jgi:alpha-tubulin suppressor-like RCC1 family protein
LLHPPNSPKISTLIVRKLALAIFCSALLTACSSTEPTASDPVASVMLAAVPPIKATHTLSLSARALDAAGNQVPNVAFTWASADNAIATVDQTGTVRGISAGKTLVTATAGTHVAAVEINVTRAPLATIQLSIPSGDLIVGKTVRVQAVAVDSSGKTATDAALKWTSATPAVAIIDSTGLVTALGAGTVRIDATAEGITGSINLVLLAPPPIHFKSIVAGSSHTCGLSTAGEAYCWGSGLGALGAGNPPLIIDFCTSSGISNPCSASPIPVAGGHVFSSLSQASTSHTCGISTDGTWCWGLGASGEIGSSAASVSNSTPVKVQSSASYISIGGGNDVTCALADSHSIDCWGSNELGQLGDSTVTETCPTHVSNGVPVVCSTTPRHVSSPVAFDKLSVGRTHSCALTQDGAAWCWGWNFRQYLGSISTSQCGNSGCSKTPVGVFTDLRFTDISVGAALTCGVSTNGKTYCWGLNSYGGLGTGIFSDGTPVPFVPVSSAVPFVKVFVGNAAACALDAAGAAFCWGKNSEGELGDGSTTDRAGPVPIGQGLKFTSLSLGDFHTCGIATDGFAYCWGSNSNKSLGVGRDGPVLIPTRVVGQ